MKLYQVLMLGLIAFLLCGCSKTDETVPAHEAKLISEITESMTKAKLRVEIADPQIDLTELVAVRVTMIWNESVAIELIEPDWIQAGWAYVTQRTGEIQFDGAAYSQTIDFELEPFLSGEYAVPSIGIRAKSKTAGRRIARLSPVTIIVASALEEGDTQDLDPAVGLAKMAAVDDDEAGVNWVFLVVFWGGLGAAFTSSLVIVWLRMRGTGNEPESMDPEAMLVAAASAKKLSEDDLRALHQAILMLSNTHGSLRSISHEIEQERFSGDAIDHQRVQSAAKRAANVCGVKL